MPGLMALVGNCSILTQRARPLELKELADSFQEESLVGWAANVAEPHLVTAVPFKNFVFNLHLNKSSILELTFYH